MIYRGASGLGDAVYMYPVLKYYAGQGGQVEILTKFPEIYEPLKPLGVIIRDRYETQPDRECRYAPRYPIEKTTTYEDTLIMAGIEKYQPLTLEYKHDKKFKFNTKKKICVIKLLSLPMKGRGDGFGLIPDFKRFQEIINHFKNDFYFVLAGNRAQYNAPLDGIDLDLTQGLGIKDLLALINQSDMVLTQPSFFLPFAESLSKKCFVIFSAEGMRKPIKFYHYIKPGKIINKINLVGYSIDEWGAVKTLERFANIAGKVPA